MQNEAFRGCVVDDPAPVTERLLGGTAALIPLWGFEGRSPTSVSTVPKGKEHFLADRQDLVSALIREMVQNALDNASGTEAVRLVFRWASYQANAFRHTFLNGIDPHLTAVAKLARVNGADLFSSVASEEAVKALLVEDYNTHGLRGSINPASWNQGEFNNFGNFFWMHGGSSKQKGAGGRHGIGKSTIVEVSDIRAFFGASYRDDSPEMVAYGQATFVPHRLDDNTLYDAYGLFGEVRDGQCLPLTGESASNVSNQIGFDRDGKPGLSLMIPYVKPEVTNEALIRAVVRHCFYQISAGLLVVEIDGVLLDASTIVGIAMAHDEVKDLVPVIELALQSSLPDREAFVAKAAETGRTSVKAELFDEYAVNRMRELWEAGEAIDIRFEVPVAKKGQQTEIGEGRLVLRKHDDRETSHEVSVRGRVTVTHTRPKSGNYVALFMSSEGPLSAFLGDSDDVSHTNWQVQRATQRYNEASDTMARVKGSFRDLYSLLTGIGQGATVPNALSNFFWTTRQTEDAKTEKPREEKRPAPLPEINVVRAERPFVIRQLVDEIVIDRQEGREGDFGAAIELFYSSIGSKKPKYHPADFDLSTSEIGKVEDGEIEWKVDAGNRIEIVSAQPGATLRITGFDANRELTVQIKTIENRE